MVLIILAGVAINIALGENGIFTKTKLAADTYMNSAANEASELQKVDGILDELINGPEDPYNGLATEDEIHPQLFMYEIITPGTASTEDGVDGVTKLADTSDTIKIAETSTKPTAKIVGYNYDYAFGSLAEYSSNGEAGSGYDNTETEESQDKFANMVRNNYSKLVIPAKVKLNPSGEYDPNGTECTVVEVQGLGAFGDDYPVNLNFYFRDNVNEIVLPNTVTSLSCVEHRNI